MKEWRVSAPRKLRKTSYCRREGLDLQEDGAAMERGVRGQEMRISTKWKFRSESMEEWEAFYEFLINCQPPRPPSECTADDAIEFLLTLPSDGLDKAADHLSAVNLQENPFRSRMVRTYLELMKIQADGEEYKSDNTGQDDKVDLFEKCLTASDVGSSNLLVVTPKEDVQTNFISHTIIGPENYLRLEDEEGKTWLFGVSYLSRSFVLTKCWRSFVKEKQLDAGDFVFFQRHLTDRRGLFIGCRRREERHCFQG